MTWRDNPLPLLLALLLLASCGGTLDVIVEGAPAAEGPTAPAAPLVGDATAAIPTNSPTPALRGVAPPPGLAYRLGNSLWLVDAEGQSIFLSDRPGAVLSPDGKEVLYQDNGIWLAGVAAGEPRSLTGPSGYMCCPQWATMVCPVMALASSEARKTQVLATSYSSAGLLRE